MIIDMILVVIQGFLNIILSPLTLIDFAVDFVASIPIVTNFLQIVAYVLPWGNLLPLIIGTFSIFLFRISLALIRTLLSIITLRGA